MKGKTPIQNLEILKEFIKQGKTLKELGEYYNVHSSSIGRALRKLGIEYNLQVRKIVKVNNMFNTIDTELKAYLLGFFAADGCVYDKFRFGLCVAEQDRYIINLFKDSIAPDSYIKETQNSKGAKNRQKQLFLRISSEEIVSDFKKYGLEERKTYKPYVIPELENYLKWHFIRGYFDGDGHLGIKTRTKYKTCRICFSNGSKEILESIQKFTKKGKLRFCKNHWKLDIENITDCKEFLDLMFKDCHYMLPRKFDKYLLVNAEVFAKSKKIAQLRNA